MPYDRAVDVEIPRRLWCGWKRDGEPRLIRRAMTAEERDALQRRADALEPALLPYLRPQDDDAVALALSGMLSGFPGVRTTGADAIGRIAELMALLEPYPAWAIKRACAYIREHGYDVVDRDGHKRKERHWAPSDSEIMAEVKLAVRTRKDAFETARALLSARVDR